VKADCAFCRILAGEIPGSFVFEDDVAAVFLDLYPVNRGHALVVPKDHSDDLVSCSPEVAGRLFQIAARFARVIVQATGADGFNVWTANGQAAGQEIFHLHLHVLPRFGDDTFGLRFPKGYPQAATREELDAMAAEIRSRA
jgi:histidine triad (HIT) family protein